MKKTYIYILFAMMAVLCAGLSSCSETNGDEDEFADWKTRNEQYFSSAYADAKSKSLEHGDQWKVIRNFSLNSEVATHDYDNIIVEVLKAGTGSGCPFYTDSVKVHYSGRLIPSKSYPQGKLFDQSWTGDYNLATMQPATFAVNRVVDGFATALQYMHIGDRWRVTIPYQLGYGSSTDPGAAYSTLIFDMTLVAYFRVEAPTQAPAKTGESKGVKGHWVYE